MMAHVDDREIKNKNVVIISSALAEIFSSFS